MTQCPYTYEMYYTAEQDMVIGIHKGPTMVCIGTTSYQDMEEYVATIADVVGLSGGRYVYGAWDMGDGRRVVTLSQETPTWDEVCEMLAEQRDQAQQCNYCRMSRSMDRYHNREPEEPELVDIGPQQTMAYGERVDLMTYKEALDHVVYYWAHTRGEGWVHLADVSRTAYEIVMCHVEIDGLHYAGESDYVSAADAQRLVDAGLAEYMEFE